MDTHSNVIAAIFGVGVHLKVWPEVTFWGQLFNLENTLYLLSFNYHIEMIVQWWGTRKGDGILKKTKTTCPFSRENISKKNPSNSLNALQWHSYNGWAVVEISDVIQGTAGIFCILIYFLVSIEIHTFHKHSITRHISHCQSLNQWIPLCIWAWN